MTVPYGEIPEMQAALDAQFGANHASTVADTHTLHLYDGNPYDDGAEIPDTTGGGSNGYAAVDVDNDSGWPDADATATKTRTVAFPDPTAAWEDARCWVLKNSVTGDITAWEFLDDVLEVDAAGDGPEVDVTVYIPNAANVSS